MTAHASQMISIVSIQWIMQGDHHESRIRRRSQIPIARLHTSSIKTTASDATLRLRKADGRVAIDSAASMQVGQNEVFLFSEKLARELIEARAATGYLVVVIDRVQNLIRIGVHRVDKEFLASIDRELPYLRLEVAYGIPPDTFVEIAVNDEVDSVYQVLQRRLEERDPELQSSNFDNFLRAPHIVVPLLSHLSSLSAEENLRFPVEVRRLSDQYRELLHDDSATIRIHKIERSHLSTWAEAQGRAFAFLDGGVARIAGLPGGEPTALRVGVYAAVAGETDLVKREQWTLQPFVVGDIIDKTLGPPIPEERATDVRRLAEAARYTLECLTATWYCQKRPEVAALFCHGPLVNQFQQYDEQEPNFLPCLNPQFLAKYGIEEAAVISEIGSDLPIGPSGKPLWSHFMAIYGYLMRKVFAEQVPIAGVVERSAGKWLAEEVIEAAVNARLVTESYRKKVQKLLRRYGISDDFLFGCVLREGEYVTPVPLDKNPVRRARPQWQAVVEKYPRPMATVLKTEETSFPFRVEMNECAHAQTGMVISILYHTARLLPRYAFPVGLDIVDKYAKVPDWLSRNVSARLAAAVLSRAMSEGDSNLVMQIRQLLAHTPRDFFYRPQI